MAAVALVVVPRIGMPAAFWWERVTTIQVGEQRLRVVHARDLGRGLRGVADLGTLDGMLFQLPRVQSPPDSNGWWMLGVPIALEIAYFDPAGRLVEIDRMEPCAAEPCAIYDASEPYRWVLETEVGTLRAAPGAQLVAEPGG
jgi:uncharacterized membrane protein (UPF0127 family)